MKKRISNYLLLTTYYLLGLIPLVRAGPVEGVERLTEGAREMITIIIQFLSDVLFDIESFDEFLFAKILLFLLIFFVVYTVLNRNEIFGRDKKITIIITSAISILAIRYLPTEFVQVILLQYSTFAVAITTLLPLMIFFFFQHQSGFGHRGRQIGWILYGAALIGITGMRYPDLGNASYIYYAGIIAVIVSVLLDSPIHAQFLRGERREIEKQRDLIRYTKLNKEYNELNNNLKTLTGSQEKRAEKILRHMRKRLDDLLKGAD